MKYKIIENFLKQDSFDYIQSIINGNYSQWLLLENPASSIHHTTYKIKHPKNTYALYHKLMERGVPVSPFTSIILTPILNSLKEEHKYKEVGTNRAKINCFFRQDENQQLGYHKDIEDRTDVKTLILYLDTNDGYTEFMTGERVPTVKNSALIFPAHELHQTVTQTDTIFRKNININFKGE